MAPCTVVSRHHCEIDHAAEEIGVTRHAGQVVVEINDRLARNYSRAGVADLGSGVRIVGHLPVTIDAPGTRDLDAAPRLVTGRAIRGEGLMAAQQGARRIAAMQRKRDPDNQQRRTSNYDQNAAPRHSP